MVDNTNGCENKENRNPQSNVTLIEPNCANINKSVVNGIPQYQDMYIFAELVAESKGRTVIIDGNTSSTTSKKLNFIGNDQTDENENNPNRLNFTTNYYDGSNGEGEYYEGFGMNDIKIVVNSSFIPQVDIQFIDIRGLAFFNQKDSPYRILFDFPPPIFKLTVKGYYGKALTYKLHLVSYTSEFSSQNGNFIIDAKFVAVTFAPLSDVLFRYVVNFPMINNMNSSSSLTTLPPANTFELILKLKNLYKAIGNKLKTDIDNKNFQSTLTSLENIDSVIGMLNTVPKNQNEVLSSGNQKPYIIIKTPQTDSTQKNEAYDLTPIGSLNVYDKLIQDQESSNTSTNLKNRLVIGYEIGTNLSTSDDEFLSSDNSIPWFNSETQNYSTYTTPLSKYKKMLLDNSPASININDTDIGEPKPFINNKSVKESKEIKTQYYSIDITDFYYKIYKEKTKLNTERENLSIIISDKINNMVIENLGMIPSIYNIFNIILTDVDRFFQIMKTKSIEAETSHNLDTNRNKIYELTKGIDTPIIDAEKQHIYSYPLIIENSNIFGGIQRERKAPINLRESGVEFPELDLVSDFMKTFSLQDFQSDLYNQRDNQNDDGTYKWLPITPFDSTLVGTTAESPYLGITDNIIDEALKIFLMRFYILTQGVVTDNFYEKKDNNVYLNMFSATEAINLASTMTTVENIKMLRNNAQRYKNNLDNEDGFYDYIQKLNYTGKTDGGEIVQFKLYDFLTDEIKSFPITPKKSNTDKVYTDRNNENFEGLKLVYVEGGIPLLDNTEDKDSTNPIDKFNIDAEEKGFLRKIFKGNPAEYFFEFTSQNLIFISDSKNNSDNVIIDGLSTWTRYLWNDKYDNSKFPDTLTQALAEGNAAFDTNDRKDKNKLNSGNNFIDLWSTQLGTINPNILNTLTGNTTLTGDTNLSPLLVLSCFGNILSPYNKYPTDLNNLIFNTPAVVEVPIIYAQYLGILVDAIENEWEDEILEYFTINEDFLNNGGYFILADLHDVKYYLSQKDKNIFKAEYIKYLNGQHNDVIRGITSLINDVRTAPIDTTAFEYSRLYEYHLNPNSLFDFSKYYGTSTKGKYFYLIKDFAERWNIINYSQLTFKMSSTEIGYTSLKTKNLNTDNKGINDKYFVQFFSKLDEVLKDKEKEILNKENALKKLEGDVDIVTQLYYSFKNINDKWLTGAPKTQIKYPYNKKGKNLIDSFAFVDRGMNPNGDTIINGEILIEMLSDHNISLFSVLTQLLSLNGFMFFPLQNFMSFENAEWEDSFKITDETNVKSSPTFVCMYMGGSASYPSVSGNGFVNDGVIDISEPGLPSFNTIEPSDTSDVQEDNNTDFPWRQVRAFKVGFGTQNQSMFVDMKIDSKEYPDTNESIQILSRLAGDNNPDAPVPKGQNLYNLYENRSYKATITGLGNMMIQPTQYFQLENVPLFNGAYVILDIEHKITQNKMVTSFSGTKLLKYPVAKVTSPVALTGYKGLSAGDIVVNALNYENILSDNKKTNYKSMYYGVEPNNAGLKL